MYSLQLPLIILLVVGSTSRKRPLLSSFSSKSCWYASYETKLGPSYLSHTISFSLLNAYEYHSSN